MKLQRLLSLVRKALDDYEMIEDGDKIAVGISGGKDSLALLYALAELRRFYPKRFELVAITVSLGFEGFDTTPLAELCEKLNVPYHVEQTQIGEIVFEARKESNPCSLCSKMRKGAFNEAAKAMGCNKAAYAHHKDDVKDTTLMSLLFEGHFYCFAPVTYLDRMDLTLIRPLIYVDERDVIGFKNLYNLPVVKNPCPADGVTSRQYVKDLLRYIEKDTPGAGDRIFTAVTGGVLPNWVPSSKRKEE